MPNCNLTEVLITHLWLHLNGTRNQTFLKNCLNVCLIASERSLFPSLLPSLSQIFLKSLKSKKTSDNKPYNGRLKNDTMFKHGTSRGLPHVLIELRQDLLNNKKEKKIINLIILLTTHNNYRC